MNNLFQQTVLRKYSETIPEKVYKEKYALFKKSYQAEKEYIALKKEEEFQSGFLIRVFNDILGYISDELNSSSGNLKIEKKMPNCGQKVDGAIVDSDGNVKIVIELKSCKTKDLFAKPSKDEGSRSPTQQAGLYAWQEPYAELIIVSNFKDLYIFDRKEHFYNYFNLFEMTYEEFKDFYLILSSKSFFKGLTKLMIEQSTNPEKTIDYNFFTNLNKLYNAINKHFDTDNNPTSKGNAEDLFLKFITVMFMEDNGMLPINTSSTLASKRSDFMINAKSDWDVWKQFFKTVKNNPKKILEESFVSENVLHFDIFTKVDYLDEIATVPKKILDLVVSNAEYDLWSENPDLTFATIASLFEGTFYDIHSPEEIGFILENRDYVFTSMALAFLSKYKHIASSKNNIKLSGLYSDLTGKKLVEYVVSSAPHIGYVPAKEFMSQIIICSHQHFLDSDFVNDVIGNLESIETVTPDGSVTFAHLKRNSGDTFLMNGIEISKSSLEIPQIIVKTSEDWIWLENYSKNSKPLSAFAERVDGICDFYYDDAFEYFSDDIKELYASDLGETIRFRYNDKTDDMVLFEILNTPIFRKYIGFQHYSMSPDEFLIADFFFIEKNIEIFKKIKTMKMEAESLQAQLTILESRKYSISHPEYANVLLVHKKLEEASFTLNRLREEIAFLV